MLRTFEWFPYVMLDVLYSSCILTSLGLNLESQRSSQEGAPASGIQSVHYTRGGRGCLQTLPGGWTDGKVLAR